MPTTRRRRLRNRQHEFTQDHRVALYRGAAFFVRYPYGNPHYGERYSDANDAPFDEEACRADWMEHRDELMAHWMQDPVEWGKQNHPGFTQVKPGGPGTRPWGWWMFDAPEPRPVVGKDYPAIVYTVPRQPLQIGVAYEGEREFLERHGLLGPGE